jgi:hypothetical protein
LARTTHRPAAAAGSVWRRCLIALRRRVQRIEQGQMSVEQWSNKSLSRTDQVQSSLAPRPGPPRGRDLRRGRTRHDVGPGCDQAAGCQRVASHGPPARSAEAVRGDRRGGVGRPPPPLAKQGLQASPFRHHRLRPLKTNRVAIADAIFTETGESVPLRSASNHGGRHAPN